MKNQEYSNNVLITILWTVFLIFELVITIFCSFHQGMIIISPLIISLFTTVVLCSYFLRTTIPSVSSKGLKTETTISTNEGGGDRYQMYWMALSLLYWWSYGYWFQLFPDIFPGLLSSIFTFVICIFVLIQLVYKSFGAFTILRMLFLAAYVFLLCIPTSSAIPSANVPITIARYLIFLVYWILSRRLYLKQGPPETGILEKDYVIYHYRISAERMVTSTLWILFGSPFLLPFIIILAMVLSYQLVQVIPEHQKGTISIPPIDIPNLTTKPEYRGDGTEEGGTEIETMTDTEGNVYWKYPGVDNIWTSYSNNKRYIVSNDGDWTEVTN
jgi:hypothetical protein